MIDVRRLKLLHEFAQQGTVAATADAMQLTGPAVSQQLAVLEREAGVPLLEKRGRNVVLTAAGRLLVSHADIIFGDLNAAESALAALKASGTGTVRLAAFPTAARALVAPMWTDVPGVSLRLVEGEPDAATALLHEEADIAIVHSYTLLPRPTPANCEVHDILEEPVLFALSAGAAARRGLAPGQKVRLARFAEDTWLAPSKEFSCNEMIQRACGAAGFVPDIVAEASDFSVLIALVATDAGVALVPRMAIPDGHGPISLHPLAAPVTRKVYALTRMGSARRPDIRAVLGRLGAHLAD
ncbi:LysR family transcriptional regulator [Kutzneria sp. CA-103260]|uniref:LysR family transcriptional regulator n=1 Tax=Kutzneria sp. CA-103260 TaxID=2802641 RepID=UPI001BA7B78B|nr:LysR family transcriptional regulator [Kutzneria sp. CA-103260]QUQ63640.1 LysR family transcriptional regulator [Kutzneria sp. CA-103260]